MHTGQAIKKAAAYSTDNGNKHIQGAEFKMTYLGKRKCCFFFAPTITINLGLMGNSVRAFKYAATQKHPITHTYTHTDANAHTFAFAPSRFLKVMDLYYNQQDHKIIRTIMYMKLIIPITHCQRNNLIF